MWHLHPLLFVWSNKRKSLQPQHNSALDKNHPFKLMYSHNFSFNSNKTYYELKIYILISSNKNVQKTETGIINFLFLFFLDIPYLFYMRHSLFKISNHNLKWKKKIVLKHYCDPTHLES